LRVNYKNILTRLDDEIYKAKACNKEIHSIELNRSEMDEFRCAKRHHIVMSRRKAGGAIYYDGILILEERDEF
jgi:hypothetical protein